MYFFLYKSLSTYYTNFLEVTFVHKTYARVVTLCRAAVLLTYLTSFTDNLIRERGERRRLDYQPLFGKMSLHSAYERYCRGLRPAVNTGTLLGTMDLEEDLKIPSL